MAKLESTFLGLTSILVEIQSVTTCSAGVTKYRLDFQGQIVDQLANLPEEDLVCLLGLPKAVEKHPNIDDLVSLAFVASRIQFFDLYSSIQGVCVIKTHLVSLKYVENISWVLKRFQDKAKEQDFLCVVVGELIQQKSYEKAARCMVVNAESFETSHLAEIVSTHCIEQQQLETFIQFVVQLGSVRECKRAALELIQHPELEQMIQKATTYGNPIGMNLLLFSICLEAPSKSQFDLISTLFTYLNPKHTDFQSVKFLWALCERLVQYHCYQEAYQLAELFSRPETMGEVIWASYVNDPEKTKQFFQIPGSVVGLKKEALTSLINQTFEVEGFGLVKLTGCMHDSDQINYLKLMIDSRLRHWSSSNLKVTFKIAQEISDPPVRKQLLDYIVSRVLSTYRVNGKAYLTGLVEDCSPIVKQEVDEICQTQAPTSSYFSSLLKLFQF